MTRDLRVLYRPVAVLPFLLNLLNIDTLKSSCNFPSFVISNFPFLMNDEYPIRNYGFELGLSISFYLNIAIKLVK